VLLKRNEKKEQDSNKDFNFSWKDEAIQFIRDFTMLALNGMLASSSRVNKSSDCTAPMRHSFTNSPSVNGFECLAITWDITYDAVMAFVKDIVSEFELQPSW